MLRNIIATLHGTAVTAGFSGLGLGSVDFAQLHGYAKDLNYPKYENSELEGQAYILMIVLIVMSIVLVISLVPLGVLLYMLYDDTSMKERFTRRLRNRQAARRKKQALEHPPNPTTMESTVPYFPMSARPPSPVSASPLVMSGSSTMHGLPTNSFHATPMHPMSQGHFHHPM